MDILADYKDPVAVHSPAVAGILAVVDILLVGTGRIVGIVVGIAVGALVVDSRSLGKESRSRYRGRRSWREEATWGFRRKGRRIVYLPF